MKKMLSLMIYGGILFGLSAGGAWFLRAQHLQALEQVRKEHEASLDASESHATEQPTVTHPRAGITDDEATRRQVPVRPEAMDVEAIVRYGMGLRERDERIRKREEALDRVEAQHRLVLADIDEEQREIEGLLAQARNQQQAADALLNRAQARHEEARNVLGQVEKERREFSADRTRDEQKRTKSPTAADDADADRRQNLKDLTAVLESMSPEGGADILGRLMNDGKDDLAVELLAGLEEKQAAKILDTMRQSDVGSDKVLEIMDRFTMMKRPEKAIRR